MRESAVKDLSLSVREFLVQEARSIELAAERLDSNAIHKALKLLLECKGKVIVTGVGKSGVIANKIAETMTSTGTVAIFLHPSDALHGGLGIITKGDCVIAISNSGETDEILMLLPSLEKRKVSIIAIVGNTKSTLARRSDVVLDASVDREACPLNLAPTNSTTVALAIGDAIAMALMIAKGLTAEDFAANHPAGRLGKRLTLRVKDLMHESPDVMPDSGWIEVISKISQYGLGAVTVVNEKKHLLGIITDGDLRRTVERTDPQKLIFLTAERMMTSSPVVAEAEMLAYDALQLMENRPSQISVLPVVKNGKCIGLIRLHDIVRSGL